MKRSRQMGRSQDERLTKTFWPIGKWSSARSFVCSILTERQANCMQTCRKQYCSKAVQNSRLSIFIGLIRYVSGTVYGGNFCPIACTRPRPEVEPHQHACTQIQMPDLTLDVRNLSFALAAADRGSSRRAAVELGLQPSTVSRRVQLLENSIWLHVRVARSGESCHVGYRLSFYRRVPIRSRRHTGAELNFTETGKTFDLKAVYRDEPGPTLL